MLISSSENTTDLFYNTFVKIKLLHHPSPFLRWETTSVYFKNHYIVYRLFCLEKILMPTLKLVSQNILLPFWKVNLEILKTSSICPIFHYTKILPLSSMYPQKNILTSSRPISFTQEKTIVFLCSNSARIYLFHLTPSVWTWRKYYPLYGTSWIPVRCYGLLYFLLHRTSCK
jgi:hypothetical protein